MSDWRSRPYGDYDTVDTWVKREGEIWNRRRVELVADKPAREPAKLPRGARDGPLHHWRRGLVGAVRDWAEGSEADAANIIFSLIDELGLQVPPPPCPRCHPRALALGGAPRRPPPPSPTAPDPFMTLSQDRLRPLLNLATTREAETDAFIVERIKAALATNKACTTEEQRREYLICLAYVAPPRLAAGNMSASWMGTLVCCVAQAEYQYSTCFQGLRLLVVSKKCDI